MDYKIQYYMKLYKYIVALMAINIVTSITKLDFNSCRINSCNAEEINCITEQAGCFNYFAIMRNCLSGCSTVQNYNSCWKGCKDNSALTNSKYLSLSLCYENVCYLYGNQLIAVLALLVLILAI